jgi:hypothetical protein
MILHFEDLAEQGIVKTWNSVNDWIENRGFPPGRLIARRRVWTEREILAWIEKQPNDKGMVRGDAKRRQAEAAAKRAAAGV